VQNRAEQVDISILVLVWLQDILRFESDPRLKIIRNAIMEGLEALKVLDNEFQLREGLGQLDRDMACGATHLCITSKSVQPQYRRKKEVPITHINHLSLSKSSPVKRCVQVVVRLRVTRSPEPHALSKAPLPPTLVLAFAIIGNKVPVCVTFGEAECTPNGGVGRLLAIAIISQSLHELSISFPDLIQIEGNPVSEDGVAEEGC
jgi:hypothetical protein